MTQQPSMQDLPLQSTSTSPHPQPSTSSTSSLSNPLDFLLNPNPFHFPHHSAIQNSLTQLQLPSPPLPSPSSAPPPVYSVSAFGVSDRPSPASLAPRPGIPNGVPGAGDCAKLCPRHQRMANEGTNRALQAEIERLAEPDQEAITTAWSLFSASNSHRRRLILTGLLTICCPSQLTFLSDSLRAACRTDPFSRLPRELSLRILANVDAFSLGRAAQVSRLWRKLADDDLLWRTMCQQHIERTCHKCGWGLPSMQKRSRDPAPNDPAPKRPRLAAPAQPCSPEGSPPPGAGPEDAARPWKAVYTERLALERNWRKGLYRESVLSGHGDSITCLQIDEHATPWPILVTGSWDRTIRVWNVDAGTTVHLLRGHSRGVRCLQFDATKLISGGMDRMLKLWNWRTGECIRTIEGHDDAVTCLNFDDELLASGSADSTIRIWNFTTGAGFVLRGHTDWVNAVRLSGQTLFSGSDDGQIRIWDLATRQTRAILGGHVAPVQALSPVGGPGPNRQVLVSGSLDNCLKVWDVASGTCERTLFGHIQGVWSVDADQLRIVSASHDRSLKIWDRVTGKCIHTIVGHRGAVTTVKLTDDKVVSGGDDGEVRIWWFGRASSS